jgi:ubiquitin thioesterase protein OTUB1
MGWKDSVEGLRLALQNAEENLRYPLSVAVRLAVLAEDFAHSPDHIRKVGELGKRGFTHVRRVRGDGNCFYRAIGFAWLEGLADRAARGETVFEPLPGGWPDASLFGDLAGVYSDLRSQVMYPAQTAAPEVGRQLLARLLVDVRFDLCAVALLRLVVAAFLMDETVREDESREGASPVSDVLAAEVALHGGVSNFVRTQVLPMGHEAEGASIAVAAMQLGVRLCIVQLDGSPGTCAEYVYPSEDYDGPFGIKVHLLFRPGHYEVLYHEDAPCFVGPDIVQACCSFCRDEAQMPVRDLFACCHRFCGPCAREANGCPICAEVIPQEWSSVKAERDRIADLGRLAEKEAKKAAREAEMARRAKEKMVVQRVKEEAEMARRAKEKMAVQRVEEEAEMARRAKEKMAVQRVKEKAEMARRAKEKMAV